jgi:hypothetical protein
MTFRVFFREEAQESQKNEFQKVVIQHEEIETPSTGANHQILFFESLASLCGKKQ